MPSYRFTTDNGKKVDKDDESMAFKDDKSAAKAAQEALADMAKEGLPDGERLDLSASVENEAGEEIYRASLKFRKETNRTSTQRDSGDDGNRTKPAPVL